MTFPALSANTSSGYFINKALRFRSAASASMNRTPSVAATDNKKFTWSGWVKRGKLSTSYLALFGAYSANTESGYFELRFNSSDQIQFTTWTLTGNTTAVFRDPSAWYHIVIAADTTQATAANRLIVYVNNQAYPIGTNLTQNLALAVNNNGAAQYLGTLSGGDYFDGYMAEVNMIDGQALTPSSFGSTNGTTGVWQPIKYTGTYGTNGYYLPFTNNTSLTALGYDSSGNNNNFTQNNFSLTTGATYDSVNDSPTLTSSSVANSCVLNPISNNTGNPIYTVTDGNLTFSCSASSGNAGKMCILGSLGTSNGKYYWEIKPTIQNTDIGICEILSTNVPTPNVSSSTYVTINANAGGTAVQNTAATYSGGTLTYTSGDTLGIAYDGVAGTMAIYKNNSLVGTFSNIEVNRYWKPCFFPSTSASNIAFTVNFGQQPYTYTPPSGFGAFNTYNLQGSTVPAGNKYMDILLWTGNNATSRLISGLNFKPDLVWAKRRNSAGDHGLMDSVRGATARLISNSTATEDTTFGLSAFNTNGFTTNSVNTAYNVTGDTQVGWCWNAGSGTTSSNTSGSITSTVTVNASAGFSVVGFTLPASGGPFTVGHGLGVAPSMIILKSRTQAFNWAVYHASLGNTQKVSLNLTDAASTGAWNSTSPTSTVFSLGTAFAGSGDEIAYCWAEIAGFSKFSSYVGNNSSDGPFVYLGFRPKFVMIKQTSGITDWILEDTSINTYNQANSKLSPNTTGAEFNSSVVGIDFVSNGFKIKGTDGSINGSGATYIYAAFAENPFKNALAR